MRIFGRRTNTDGTTTRRYPQAHATGFIAMTRENPDTGCMEWTGPVNNKGYGQLWVDGRRVGAHRHARELTDDNGPIPEGMQVLYRCDNRRCTRGDHLFLGTNPDNMADMVAKGRSKRCNKPGESNHNAKLTDGQVQKIRNRWNQASSRWGLQTALAAECGVSSPHHQPDLAEPAATVKLTHIRAAR
jgi:hypothetical protein